MSICEKCGVAFTEELRFTCLVASDSKHVEAAVAPAAASAAVGDSNFFSADTFTKALDTTLDVGIDVYRATAKKASEVVHDVGAVLPDTSTVESASEFVQNLGAGVIETAGSVGSSVLEGVGAVAEGAGEVVGAVAEAAGDILSGL